VVFSFLASLILATSTILSGGMFTPGPSDVMPAVFHPFASDAPSNALALNLGQALQALNDDDPDTTPANGPDLIISSITWSPANPQFGDRVTSNVTIKNQGNTQAVNSHVDCFIDGVTRGYQSVSRLDAGATTNSTFYWIALPGSHEIKAKADVLGQVDETDESNNEKSMNISTLAPDLVIQSITYSPTFPLEGFWVALEATVSNQGKGKSYSSSVGFYMDDTLLTSEFVGPLEAGAATNVNSWWIATPGPHAIKAVADASQGNVESDEDNNTKIMSMATLDPDLFVKSILISPASPSEGEHVKFTIVIKNQGNSEAGAFRINFNIDLASYIDYVDRISAGSEVSVIFPWTATSGAHTVKTEIDTENLVIEANETNNIKTGKFSISKAPAPDLVIQDIIYSPDNPAAGDNITLTATVKNQGNEPSSPSKLSCYVDSMLLASDRVETLGAGASSTVDFKWAVKPGSHVIKMITDSTKEIAESDETNNEQTITFPISMATEISINPPAGQTASVSGAGKKIDVSPTTPSISQAAATGTSKGQITAAPAAPPPKNNPWLNWWLIGSVSIGTIYIVGAIIMVKKRKDSTK
jgi:subtilase family serine protease